VEERAVSVRNGRPEGWVFLTGAAVALGVTRSAILSRVKRGQLPSQREEGTQGRGGQHLVNVEEARALFEQKSGAALLPTKPGEGLDVNLPRRADLAGLLDPLVDLVVARATEVLGAAAERLLVQAERRRRAAEELERQPASATRARQAAEEEYQRLALMRRALDARRSEILEVMAANAEGR
jgi:hypothetical protein